MTQLERAKVEYDVAQKAFSQSMKEAYDEPSLEEFQVAQEEAFRKLKPYQDAYNAVREIKMCELPEYGDHITLQNFIEACEDGMFIDYDGHGRYATSTQMTDLTIVPSDVTSGDYLTKYSHVVWFNR